MARQDRIGKGATQVFTDSDGMTKVIYHSTPVVSFDRDWIILDTGGWRTVTTKTRMNQASGQFALGFRVSQERGEWIVTFKGKDLRLVGNTMKIARETPICPDAQDYDTEEAYQEALAAWERGRA